jgi:hypothetical protein
LNKEGGKEKKFIGQKLFFHLMLLKEDFKKDGAGLGMPLV